MKKQFDLQYYLEHPETKVVTREGRSVRIICTDAMSENHIKLVGLVQFSDYEDSLMFNPNGLVFENREDAFDIFFDLPEPEKKRVPLSYVDLLERVKANKTMWVTDKDGVALLIVKFGDSGWYGTGINLEHTISSLMEQQMYFADGTPCWKEVEE